MDILALALFFGLVAAFVIRAWKAQGWLSGRDRWSLLTSFAVAATTFVIAPLLINWVIVPTAIWFTAVALLAGGVIGAVLRWPELAWFSGAADPARNSRWSHLAELHADRRRSSDLIGPHREQPKPHYPTELPSAG